MTGNREEVDSGSRRDVGLDEQGAFDPATQVPWEIEEDDFGDPMIFHRHQARTVPAYVIGREADHLVAQCSECMATRDVPSSAAVPSM